MLGILALLACFGNATDGKAVFWTAPGSVENIDLSTAHGGKDLEPKPPFQFIKEETGGTSPKVTVRDAAGAEWRVKGGLEARPETFVTRFIRALGYYTETMYFLPAGRIEGITKLERASGFVKPDGSFTYASFERLEPHLRFAEGEHWTYRESPFKSTPQFQGLKILVMLVSNWDNKDARDRRRGSNTSILHCKDNGSETRIHFVNDWGQTLGRWGHSGIFGRTSMWDCRSYTAQTESFVTRVEGLYVRFGFAGQHTGDFKNDITVDDVRWLMQYLGRITDAQIRSGLLASGATTAEQDCFTKALRDRIEQLRRVADPQSVSRYSK